MPFDSVVLSAVASEIRRSAVPGQVVKIYQPSAWELIFHLRALGGRRALYASIHPERFRIHFVEETPENPPTPPQSCMVLRKHLEGAKLVALEQSGGERVLKLRFERSDGSRDLMVEMMGKHSNVALVDDEGRIVEALKHVSRRVNRVREMLPQRPYLPPPPQAKPDPMRASVEEIAGALATAGDPLTPPRLVKALGNVGPFMAREILARATSSEAMNVAEAAANLAGQVKAEAFVPTLLLDEEGRPADVWAFEIRAFPLDRQEVAPGISAALEVIGRFGGGAGVLLERDREEARATLAGLRDRMERRLADLAAAREAAERAEEHRITGELILANADRLERGLTEVELENYYDPSLGRIRVELDPTLSIPENAEAYFRRRRKAKAGLPLLVERIAETERQRDRWARLASEVATADAGRLREIAAETETAAPQDRAQTAETQEAARRPAPGVRRTVSSDGYEIWYGDHKEGNDTLTSRLAAPTDLWLHVRAGASAHVVIRTRKRPESVPPRTLKEAARIAVAHSESKHSGITPVDYTLKKYVRKPRGSGPGQALYTNEKTVFVESEDAR